VRDYENFCTPVPPIRDKVGERVQCPPGKKLEHNVAKWLRVCPQTGNGSVGDHKGVLSVLIGYGIRDYPDYSPLIVRTRRDRFQL
jgi:hypothetical protein